MSDLGTQLREYFDATAPPVELDEIISDEVWVPAKDEPRRRRFMFPGWAYGVASMVVIVLFTLGLALLPVADENEVVDEPTPTTKPSQPPNTAQPQPPPDLSGESGTLDTLLGPIPWIHAVQIGPLPNPDGVIQTPDGFAGVADDEVSDGRYRSLWITSSDGVTWAEAPFPVPLDPQGVVHVGEIQGRYWLTDGARLWLSDDAEVWTEADLSEITPPPSAGVVWIPLLESPAASGELTVFPLLLQPELPVREIFDPRSDFTGGVHRTNCGWDWELEACQGVADDVDVVFGVDQDTGEETLLARFRLEAGDETAYVVDIDTDDRVHEFSITGFKGDQLTGISGSDLHWNAVVLVGSEPAATVVEPPWSSFGRRSIFLAAVENRFLAYVDNGPPHGATTLDAIEVWESDDGLTWTSRGTVDFGIEASGEVDLTLFDDGGGRLVGLISELDGRTLPSEAHLISTDGLNWEPDAPDAPGSWVERIEDGFVSFGDGVFVSEDGDQWGELISFDPPVGDIAFIVGDTLIVALVSDGTHDVWAFDLEP